MTGTALTRLDPQLAEFARIFAETSDKSQAAAAAGVHPERAAVFAAHALANPAVREAVDAFMRGRFAEAAPAALGALIAIVQDITIEPGVRRQASRDILDRSGFSVRDIANAKAVAPDLAAMTPDELRAVLSSTESELADRAKAVEVAPQIGASSLQVIDMEG